MVDVVESRVLFCIEVPLYRTKPKFSLNGIPGKAEDPKIRFAQS